MAKRILIVDDEPLIVKGLKYSLEQDGYETDSAADGEEAVNSFFAGNFDLVLLDVMLPKLNGIEVCHPDMDEKTTILAKEAAKAFHLYRSGGTDHTGAMSACGGAHAVPALQGIDEEDFYIIKERKLG